MTKKGQLIILSYVRFFMLVKPRMLPTKIAQPFMAGKIANPASKSRQGWQNISFVPDGTCGTDQS